MRRHIKTLDELKDSYILFNKDIPSFGYIILHVILVLFILVTIWSIKVHKPYVIITNGMITNSNTSYVMSSYIGEIERCYMKEGMLVQEGDVLFTIKSIDYNLQEEQLLSSKKTYEKQITQAERLVQSMKDDINYFDVTNVEDALYYNTFEVYKSQVAQYTFDGSMYKEYGYTDEQIIAELEKNQGKITEIYYSAIQSAEDIINESNLQIEAIDVQIAAIRNGQSEYSVKAVTTGILHLLGDYKVGMVVQTGSAIATITPENSEIIIESYVSTSDVTRMNEGSEVQIAVDGLMQSVYGSIDGIVDSIDSNVTYIQNEGSEAVFKIKIKPKEDYLVSKNGKKINLSNGMTVEVRIIYDEVTYFDYILEKLGLLMR